MDGKGKGKSRGRPLGQAEPESSSLPFGAPPCIANTFAPAERIVLCEGDVLSFLPTLPSNLVRLVVTSPPYNIGKEYEKPTSLNEYLKQQAKVIDELVRVLADDGSICWEVGNFVGDGEVVPLDIMFYPLFKERGLILRNRIVWHFGHGLHAAKRFSGRYETILWFTKSEHYLFNLDAVRIPAKYPGKTYYKGPNRGKPSGNPLGKNPSDVWQIVCMDWEKELWEIPNVKSNHPEKTIHPCQFPVELVERCVLALTAPDDWVLDPYAGVGSALLAGLIHNRRVIGCDMVPEYVAVAKRRIRDLHSGNLKIRRLGRPIHQPSGREKVSRWPEGWPSLDLERGE